MKREKISSVILLIIIVILMLANVVFWFREMWPDGNLANKIVYLIFFELSDCPTCLFEAEFWGKISQIYNEKIVKIVGITNTNDREKIAEFCKEYSLLFPIAYDKDSQYKARILSDKEISKINLYTPFKIFMDSSRKILLVDKANKNIDEQKRFINKVQQLLKENDG